MLQLFELLKPRDYINNYQDAIVTINKRCCKKFFPIFPSFFFFFFFFCRMKKCQLFSNGERRGFLESKSLTSGKQTLPSSKGSGSAPWQPCLGGNSQPGPHALHSPIHWLQRSAWQNVNEETAKCRKSWNTAPLFQWKSKSSDEIPWLLCLFLKVVHLNSCLSWNTFNSSVKMERMPAFALLPKKLSRLSNFPSSLDLSRFPVSFQMRHIPGNSEIGPVLASSLKLGSYKPHLQMCFSQPSSPIWNAW